MCGAVRVYTRVSSVLVLVRVFVRQEEQKEEVAAVFFFLGFPLFPLTMDIHERNVQVLRGGLRQRQGLLTYRPLSEKKERKNSNKHTSEHPPASRSWRGVGGEGGG